ncbi:MAG TPA: ABC transporter ATP-binding protein [Candidatus Saccharimonadales bacterium]|nr:ABC transporter ATP-binding protein [Candidatus Saccharimonadales bacterium]
MPTAISIHNLSVTLGGTYQALKDITVDLEGCKIIGCIGPSGAGKTTLLRCLVGRQKFTAGSIQIFDTPAGAAQLRPRLSYMTQELSVYEDLTVLENVRYFAAMRGFHGSDAHTHTDEVLVTVDLTDKRHSLVRDLSGGQKQRVSLAIALLGEPPLMMLDEPTVGLDPVLREQLWTLFHKLAAAGTTLLISSHVMDEAERCDDLLLVRDGKLLAHDTPTALRHKNGVKTVEQAFLKLVGDAA